MSTTTFLVWMSAVQFYVFSVSFITFWEKKRSVIIHYDIHIKKMKEMIKFTNLFENLPSEVGLCHVSKAGFSTHFASDITIQIGPLQNQSHYYHRLRYKVTAENYHLCDINTVWQNKWLMQKNKHSKLTSHLMLKEKMVLNRKMTQKMGHTVSPSQKIRDSAAVVLLTLPACSER